MGTLTEAVDQTDKKGPMAELVDKINAGHQEIVGATKNMIEKACATGKLLLEAKTRIKHGRWQKWMTDNLLFTERTAQRYMLIAENETKWRGKTDTVSDSTLQRVIDLVTAPKPQADKGTADDKASKKATVGAAKRGPKAASKRASVAAAEHAGLTPVQKEEVMASAEAPVTDDGEHHFEVARPSDNPDKALAELKWAMNHWVPKLRDDQLPAIKQYFDELVDKRIAMANATKAIRVLKEAA
jgi:hypothetical protein